MIMKALFGIILFIVVLRLIRGLVPPFVSFEYALPGKRIVEHGRLLTFVLVG